MRADGNEWHFCVLRILDAVVGSHLINYRVSYFGA